jgi:hypothetical protein
MRSLKIVVLLLAAAACAGCDAAMSPLHEAAISGNTQAVQAWIAQKRNLDVTFDEPSRGLEGNYARMRGVTALMLASRSGQLEVVKLLVEGGANLYAEARPRDEVVAPEGRLNAFDYAVENAVEGRLGNGAEIVAYLWSKSDGVRFGNRLGRQILAACQRSCNDKAGGDARTNPALFLIDIAPDGPRGWGIGQAACFSNRPMEVLAFLEKHAVKFPKNTLHCAAYATNHNRSEAERIAIVTFFLDHGADLEDLGFGYATPLMGAAGTENLAMVKFLLSRGANPNTRNSVGFNSVLYASNHCHGGGGDARPQLAVIEHLAGAGAETKLPAPRQGARAEPQLLLECCGRTPKSTAQQRICQVFGL